MAVNITEPENTYSIFDDNPYFEKLLLSTGFILLVILLYYGYKCRQFQKQYNTVKIGKVALLSKMTL